MQTAQFDEQTSAATTKSILIVGDPARSSLLVQMLKLQEYDVAFIPDAETVLVEQTLQQFPLILLASTGQAARDHERLQQLQQAGWGSRLMFIPGHDRANLEDLLGQIAAYFARLSPVRLLLQTGLHPASETGDPLAALIGQSPAIIELRQMIRHLALMPSTVLIEGASGTGKELVARALHALSPRHNGPFVPVNCGAISAELMESEFFGHVKGAFTGAHDNREGFFAMAQHGTLFLDEIGELPLAMQAKLLRVLEDHRLRQVGGERELALDVRIISATNRDLEKEVAAGRFRADLYYRLNVVAISLPQLDSRKEDIPVLAQFFCEQIAAALGLPGRALAQADMDLLVNRSWPGNVRELRNAIERWLIFGRWEEAPAGTAEAGGYFSARAPLATVEKSHILNVLGSVNGNRTRAAEILGVSRRTLERKIAQWRRAGDSKL